MNETVSSVQTTTHGPVWVAQAFLLSLLIPFYIPLGPVLLMPHRIVIILAFMPFFLRLFVSKKAGPVLASDWLLLFSALWAGISLALNHSFSGIIEPFGIHMVEFFGAYLLARVSIRCASDFRRVVWVFFLLVALLLPLAALESITHRAVLLEMLPGNSVSAIDIGKRFGLRRAQTAFAHPILFGVFVSTGLGLFWYALRPRWLRFPAVPIVALATIFSLSTGALISFVMQSGFIGWETIMRTLKRRWTLFAILSIIGYFVVDLLSNRTPFHVLVTYATFSTGSAYNRILIWQYGMENIWNNPIFGLGLNEWERPRWMSSSVDNFWLLLGMRYGFPGILMVLSSLALLLRRVARMELHDPEDRLCRSAYLVAFGGLFVAGGTVHFWHAMMAFVMFIYGSGVWTISGGAGEGVATGSETNTSDERKSRSRYTRQPASGGAIGRSVNAANNTSGVGKRSPNAPARVESSPRRSRRTGSFRR